MYWYIDSWVVNKKERKLIHLFSKHLLNICYEPGILLSDGDTTVKKNGNVCPYEFYIQKERQQKNINKELMHAFICK